MKRNLQKGILVTSACAAFLLGNVQQAYAVAADGCHRDCTTKQEDCRYRG